MLRLVAPALLLASPASGAMATISNTEPRRDTSGTIMVSARSGGPGVGVGAGEAET